MWKPADVVIDFIGSKTRRIYEAGMPGHSLAGGVAELVTPPYPSFDNEYFEWVDILESVAAATGSFVMVELGAGFGRWSIRAALAVRRKRGCRFHSIAVEAEPHHFRWLVDHFKQNDVDPGEHELVWAAIGAQPGFVPFWTGEASGWYGQAVSSEVHESLPDVKTRRRLKARSLLGRPPVQTEDGKAVIWVPRVTLKELLAPHPHVDLIDIDVQGCEVEVLESAMDLLNERVRRIHIGTHSAQIEEELRSLFSGFGWEKRNDYPCLSQALTPYGEMTFGDGVQTWLNPAPGSLRATAHVSVRSSVESEGLVAALHARVADLSEQNQQLKAETARRAVSKEVIAGLRARVAEVRGRYRQLEAEMERRSAEFQDMVKELRARVESAESREVVAALRARVDDLKERNRELKAEALGLREKQQALRANGQVTTTSRSWKRLVPGWLARLRRRFG